MSIVSNQLELVFGSSLLKNAESTLKEALDYLNKSLKLNLSRYAVLDIASKDIQVKTALVNTASENRALSSIEKRILYDGVRRFLSALSETDRKVSFRTDASTQTN